MASMFTTNSLSTTAPSFLVLYFGSSFGWLELVLAVSAYDCYILTLCIVANAWLMTVFMIDNWLV